MSDQVDYPADHAGRMIAMVVSYKGVLEVRNGTWITLSQDRGSDHWETGASVLLAKYLKAS